MSERTWTVTYRGQELTLTTQEYEALWRASYDDPAEAQRLAEAALAAQMVR